MTRQAAIDALVPNWAYGGLGPDDYEEWWTTPRSLAEGVIAHLDAHPEAAAALRAYLPGDEHPHPPHVTEFYTLRDGDLRTTALPGDDLGTAWAEAKAALPEGQHLCDLSHDDAGWENGGPRPAGWQATTWNGTHDKRVAYAYGPTPTAALRALTARLKEAGRD